MAHDTELPRDIAVELDSEYDLIIVRDRGAWRRLWDAMGQLPDRGAPDLSAGLVVGLLARAGEPADGAWPLHIDGVRLLGGVGTVEGRMSSGIYYPVIGPSRLVLVHVPGLRRVAMVHIGPERFMFEAGG